MDEKLLQSMTDSMVDEVHPEEIILFGSHAKGEGREESDLDFLVIMPDSAEAGRGRRRVTARLYRRLASIPVPIDILVYTRGEMERWRDVQGHVVATGLNEGRRLYVRP